jgi:hypothetical protein
MATFNSDLVTSAAERLPSNRLRDGDTANGKLTLATANVTLTGATATSDILQIIPALNLPVDAVVVPQLCSVTCSADPGTTLTLDVGYAANPDAYADGIVLSSGGQVAFTSGTIPAAVGTPVRTDADGAIYATVASASTITNGTILTFIIAYRSK